MTDEHKQALLLVLCRGADGHRVAVELESFLRFNARMDQDLQQLVDRWSDYITPHSRRRSQRGANQR
jgi:hypothetical protein